MPTEQYEGREWHIDDSGGSGNTKSFHCDAWAYNDNGEKVHGTANYISDIESGGFGEWHFSGVDYNEADFGEDWDDEYEPEMEDEDDDEEE
jgi:hypothetical protein